jgi:hypothetical protein
MVEILPEGVAVDHGPDKAELAHGAFELVGSGIGVLQGEMSEAGIARRPLRDFAGEEVVRLALHTAVAVSRSIWTPGPEIASTERAMPPRSIASSRMSPKSGADCGQRRKGGVD